MCAHGGRSAKSVIQCDACAGSHQKDLQAAGCTAAEVQSWCDSSSGALPHSTGNPLSGLPALPKVHNSYGTCQKSNIPAPNVACPIYADSSNPLQVDFARITHAWAIEIALGGGCCPGGMARDDDGNTLWDPTVLEKSLNKTEVVEATKILAKAGNASLTVNFSPWAYFWGGQVGVNANRSGPANPAVRNSECPPGWPAGSCDPSVRGIDEVLELRFFRTQLQTISRLVNATNAELGSNVRIGGILLDSEHFLINFANATQVEALRRKDNLIYNVSREFCDPAFACTIEQYNRGTIAREATDAKPDEGIPPDDAWTPWPGTSYTAYPLAKKSTWGAPTYDTFGTSLYMIPEIGCKSIVLLDCLLSAYVLI